MNSRRIWQALSTVAHNGYIPAFFTTFLYQGPLKSGCTPTLNCYACPSAFLSCPIGTLQNFAVRKQFPFFLLGFFGIVGIAAGRMTCGWLCPFGFLQDGMKRISRRIVHLPAWAEYLKYVSLVVLAIVLPVWLAEAWFSKLCPQGAIEGAIPWVAAAGAHLEAVKGLEFVGLIGRMFWIKISILAVFLVATVFIKRPFCRTACPMGAILSLFNRASFVRLRVDRRVCKECSFCQDVCPVDLVAYKQVDSPACIKCLECVKCPRGAIEVALGFGPRPAQDPGACAARDAAASRG